MCVCVGRTLILQKVLKDANTQRIINKIKTIFYTKKSKSRAKRKKWNKTTTSQTYELLFKDSVCKSHPKLFKAIK